MCACTPRPETGSPGSRSRAGPGGSSCRWPAKGRSASRLTRTIPTLSSGVTRRWRAPNGRCGRKLGRLRAHRTRGILARRQRRRRGGVLPVPSRAGCSAATTAVRAGARSTRCSSCRRGRVGAFRRGCGPGLALDRTEPHDANLLVVGIELGGLMRSTDGGESWQNHRPGAQPDVHSLAWHPRAPVARTRRAAVGPPSASTEARAGSPPTKAEIATTRGRSRSTRTTRLLVPLGEHRALCPLASEFSPAAARAARDRALRLASRQTRTQRHSGQHRASGGSSSVRYAFQRRPSCGIHGLPHAGCACATSWALTKAHVEGGVP
jgi:hypothetical protein